MYVVVNLREHPHRSKSAWLLSHDAANTVHEPRKHGHASCWAMLENFSPAPPPFGGFRHSDSAYGGLCVLGQNRYLAH